MTDLCVHPSPPAPDGTVLAVTPESAGWRYVGFEALLLSNGIQAHRATFDREVCIVVVAGHIDIDTTHGRWVCIGRRSDPWSGPPDAVYLPSGVEFCLQGEGEVALCWAPAPSGGAPARLLPGRQIDVKTRGYAAQERTIHPILMVDQDADSLLVCEVLTPGGHWSSYPPHKHDVDNPPTETLLEETYYHRVKPESGFALQRVYSPDRSLDATLSIRDRDCVLVPNGYHTVSAPPGYDLYYLNVMAGPCREWAVVNDPDHDWRAALPSAQVT